MSNSITNSFRAKLIDAGVYVKVIKDALTPAGLTSKAKLTAYLEDYDMEEAIKIATEHLTLLLDSDTEFADINEPNHPVFNLVKPAAMKNRANQIHALYVAAELAEKATNSSTTDDQPTKKTKKKKKNKKADASVMSELDLDQSTLMLAMMSGGGGSLADLVDPVKLIGMYNPHQKSHLVTRILRGRYGSQKVIAFHPGTKRVAVADTVAYLSELEEGYEERAHILVEGRPVRLYAVGVIPDNLVPENPLFKGEPLRGGNEICEHTGRSYANIPLQLRQLMRLAVNSHELTGYSTTDDLHDIIDRFEDKGMAFLRRRYPEAAIKFDELQTAGQLPTLKVELGSTTETKRQKDYRDIGTNYQPGGNRY